MAQGPIKLSYPTNTDAVDLVGTSTKYTLYDTETIRSRYLIRGRICYLTIMVHCVTPAANSEAICTAPEIAACLGKSVSFYMRNYYDPTNGVAALLQNGILYVIGGTAGADYAATISYPID